MPVSDQNMEEMAAKMKRDGERVRERYWEREWEWRKELERENKKGSEREIMRGSESEGERMRDIEKWDKELRKWMRNNERK